MDKGTLLVTAWTEQGFGGPYSYFVDRTALLGRQDAPPEFVEVGRETALHRFEPFTDDQRALLHRLAEMTI